MDNRTQYACQAVQGRPQVDAIYKVEGVTRTVESWNEFTIVDSVKTWRSAGQVQTAKAQRLHTTDNKRLNPESWYVYLSIPNVLHIDRANGRPGCMRSSFHLTLRRQNRRNRRTCAISSEAAVMVW